jgi:SAM-dependent methyltransferase
VNADPFDVEAATKLVAQMSADFAGALVMSLAYAGDRLGLFRVLADGKPRTSSQLAADASLNERYVREWASALVASGYLSYDPQTGAFRMTAEQAAVLTESESPFYFAGSYLYAQACVRQLPALMDAFREGGGVSFAEFGPEISEAIEKLFANGYRDAVASQWVPAVPGLAERLSRGGQVAEVGCGGGRALLALAAAFPGSTFAGYDLDDTSLERARASARELKLHDRVRFERRRAEDLPASVGFDLIMAFNCIHDMTQPVDALRGVRNALADDGCFLWSEARASDRLEENVGPFRRNLYAASCMHCMTVALTDGGVGLGTVVGESTVRRLASAAGFSACEPLSVEHPYHRLYLLRK